MMSASCEFRCVVPKQSNKSDNGARDRQKIQTSKSTEPNGPGSKPAQPNATSRKMIIMKQIGPNHHDMRCARNKRKILSTDDGEGK